MKIINVLRCIIYITLVSVLLNSCSSGKKALEKGNYYESVIKSVNRLKSSPGNNRASKTLKQAYPMAVKWYQENIDMTLSADQPLKWTKVVTYYEYLNQMSLSIKRCPGALRVIPNTERYDVKLAEAKKMAAPECYDAGILALKKQTREDAKVAYYHFVNANEYVPEYKDVRLKMEEAHDKATLKVLIKHIPFSIGKYEVNLRFFQDRVEQYYTTNYRKEFIRFYTDNDVANEVINQPDHVVSLKFFDFNIGSTKMLKNTLSVTSVDSVKVGDVKLKDGTMSPVYNKVNAKVNKNRIEVGATGVLSLKIVDAHFGRVLLNDKINGNFVWFHEWGSYNGDERALTPELKKITTNQAIVVPPNSQDLFSEFTNSIYNELVTKLNSFYNRY